MTTTQTPKPRQLPWLKYSEDVDRQIAAHTSGARVVNGTPTYRDAGSSECYTVGYGGERYYETKPAVVVNGASEKQARFIDNLIAERVHTYTEIQVTEAKADWRKTRKMIDFLLAQPKVQVLVKVEVPVEAPAARLNFSAIPDGYYALRTEGVVKFFRVSTSKKGYKNVQSQASDTLYLLFGKVGIAILHRLVEAGLEASQALYAEELGRCWTCGRTLTDEESRAVGQGPICRGK